MIWPTFVTRSMSNVRWNTVTASRSSNTGDLKVFLGNRVLASRIQFRRHLSPISGEDVVERLLIALLGDGNAPSLSSSSIFPLCRCADY